jgi:lysyl-tRNA synthetase class 2
MQAVRSFFYNAGYVEADTPLRLPVLIPEHHIQPFSSGDFYLQTSPELCMKRLLAAGSSKLFQICHCFRQEEMGQYHQTEFTMLEWYHVGWSYTDLMEECERFLVEIARFLPESGVDRDNSLTRDGRIIDLTTPWQRISVEEAFRKYTGTTALAALKQNLFDELLVTKIEPHLGWDKPVFLYDYPVELGSLARRKKEDDSLSERFELYIGGIELANGFSELVDPGEQRERFRAEMTQIQKAGLGHPALPEKFLADLDRLGETAGIALGLDRLFMILLGCASVAEVACFSSEDL